MLPSINPTYEPYQETAWERTKRYTYNLARGALAVGMAAWTVIFFIVTGFIWLTRQFYIRMEP